MKIEAANPPPEAIATALSIAKAGNLDVCGIEYLVNSEDGESYFYDVNGLSNFVTGAVDIVGFDPFSRFVDYVVQRAGKEITQS